MRMKCRKDWQVVNSATSMSRDKNLVLQTTRPADHDRSPVKPKNNKATFLVSLRTIWFRPSPRGSHGPADAIMIQDH